MSHVWNIINNNHDIDVLLEKYHGFHDACICHIEYISGASVDENGGMSFPSSDRARLNITFQSQIALKTLELQFIGLRRMNLIGYQENYFCDISGCYLSLYKSYIIWADSDCFNPEKPCENKLLSEAMVSFIVADKLQWHY